MTKSESREQFAKWAEERYKPHVAAKIRKSRQGFSTFESRAKFLGKIFDRPRKNRPLTHVTLMVGFDSLPVKGKFRKRRPELAI